MVLESVSNNPERGGIRVSSVILLKGVAIHERKAFSLLELEFDEIIFINLTGQYLLPSLTKATVFMYGM
jgi:hypothetical protein